MAEIPTHEEFNEMVARAILAAAGERHDATVFYELDAFYDAKAARIAELEAALTIESTTAANRLTLLRAKDARLALYETTVATLREHALAEVKLDEAGAYLLRFVEAHLQVLEAHIRG
jgi:hypothetical protein